MLYLFIFQVAFSSVPKALIKTSVMMIGEFEFDSIFNDSANNKVPYPAVSYILFVCFLIIMSILLMNLLVSAMLRCLIKEFLVIVKPTESNLLMEFCF